MADGSYGAPYVYYTWTYFLDDRQHTTYKEKQKQHSRGTAVIGNISLRIVSIFQLLSPVLVEKKQ